MTRAGRTLTIALAACLAGCDGSSSTLTPAEFATEYNALLDQAYPDVRPGDWSAWDEALERTGALTRRWSDDWSDSGEPISRMPEQIIDVARIEPWPCDELDEATQLVAKFEAEGILRLLDEFNDQAPHRPRPWPSDSDINERLEASMPSTGGFRRSLMRALDLRMRLAASRGDAEGLLTETRRARAACAHTSLLLVEDFIADTMFQMTLREIRALAGDGTLPPEACPALLELVRQRRNPPLRLVLEADFLCAAASGADNLKNAGKPARWNHDLQRAYRDAIDQTLQDPAETLAEASRFTLPDMIDTVITPEDSTKADWIELVASSAPLAMRNDLINTFEVTSTELVLAIEIYRHREGRPPPSLETLVPEFFDSAPVDMSWGGPYVYRVDPDAPGGYALYSRGTDGEDNQGAELTPRAADAYSSPLELRGFDVQLRPERRLVEDVDD